MARTGHGLDDEGVKARIADNEGASSCYFRLVKPPRDPKITPITRHDPRTFYATRVTRSQSSEAFDLWAVGDGRRVGFLSVIDDGHVVYALAAVKQGTGREEVVDLVEGLFSPSATKAHNLEVIVSEYAEEPAVYDSDIHEA